ncbi:unnamed protein product [Soboliphyme baturini]|uniref:Uncharacterized protein n=1 Tax=Soboliphyme baturini TaxID=241478 RepID=A0A183IBJ4_9BILA|nr:unnamed protein product [Soboliphyme baturini]
MVTNFRDRLSERRRASSDRLAMAITADVRRGFERASSSARTTMAATRGGQLDEDECKRKQEEEEVAEEFRSIIVGCSCTPGVYIGD